MEGTLRRASTATPLSRVPEPVVPVAFDSDWAQAELSSYFKQHPEKLSLQLDRIMDRLRQSHGDMQGFILELDTMIDQLNADIDFERRDVEGRSRYMKDYPDVTNEFLHFFLDGIMEAMEKEQGANTEALSATTSGGSGASRSSSRPGSSKERFASVPRHMML